LHLFNQKYSKTSHIGTIIIRISNTWFLF